MILTPQRNLFDAMHSLGNRSLRFGGVEVDGFAKGKPKNYVGVLRFLIYGQLCHERSSTGVPYRWCLATDFRDVVFQANPFAARWLTVGRAECGRGACGTHPTASARCAAARCAPELVLMTEHASSRFGPGATVNRKWVTSCGGTEAAHQFHAANYSVICAGVLLGTPSGFAALARLVLGHSRRCGRKPSVGFDQGFLNYMVYSGKFQGAAHAGLLMQPHGGGLVATLTKSQRSLDAHAPIESRYPLGADHVITNYDGSVPPVVHQYDRMLPYGDAYLPAAVARYVSGTLEGTTKGSAEGVSDALVRAGRHQKTTAG